MLIPEFEAIGMELILLSLTSHAGFNAAVNAVADVLVGEADAGSQPIVARKEFSALKKKSSRLNMMKQWRQVERALREREREVEGVGTNSSRAW